MNKGAMLFHMLRVQMSDVTFKSLLHSFYAKYEGKTATVQDFEQMAIASAKSTPSRMKVLPNLAGYFAQWMNSTGIPEFTMEYVTYRTRKGFRVVGKIHQPLDTFEMPVQLRIDTEGNPEMRWIDATGLDSEFMVETFGRPKACGIKIDPNNYILKSTPGLRARAAIARGEELAEVGKYYDAVQQYQKALSIQPNRSLANFRMGEAFFYQKNYQASANAFREALQTRSRAFRKMDRGMESYLPWQDIRPAGSARTCFERIQQGSPDNDNTGSAQEVVEILVKKPYTEAGMPTLSREPPQTRRQLRHQRPKLRIWLLLPWR